MLNILAVVYASYTIPSANTVQFRPWHCPEVHTSLNVKLLPSSHLEVSYQARFKRYLSTISSNFLF